MLVKPSRARPKAHAEHEAATRRASVRAAAMRQEAGELEARAMSLTRSMSVLEGERARLLIQSEVLRWRADEVQGA